MRLIFIVEIISYFGVIGLQAYWQIRGTLTEQSFALYQVASLSLIMITAVLYYSSPKYPFGLVVGTIATIVFAIIGYPIVRWIYRQLSPPK